MNTLTGFMVPVPPTFIADGGSLPVGVYDVKTIANGGGYTVARTVGVVWWFPLVGGDDLVWKTWFSFADASKWMEEQGSALCDYPLWGH